MLRCGPGLDRWRAVKTRDNGGEAGNDTIGWLHELATKPRDRMTCGSRNARTGRDKAKDDDEDDGKLTEDPW